MRSIIDKRWYPALRGTVSIVIFLALTGMAVRAGGQTLLPVFAQKSGTNAACAKIFGDVQEGISAGNVSRFSPHFHDQVHISLRGGESGVFSANQAYYLLQNYLRNRRVARFTFTTYGESDATPYATGGVSVMVHGAREYAQVYVALVRAGNRWAITHVNIY